MRNFLLERASLSVSEGKVTITNESEKKDPPTKEEAKRVNPFLQHRKNIFKEAE